MDLEVFIRTYGKWGVVAFVGVLALLGSAKLIKSGLIGGAGMIKSLFEGTLQDARQERDAAKKLREQEHAAFMQALRDQTDAFRASSEARDKAMRQGFDEVLRELRDRESRSQRTGSRK